MTTLLERNKKIESYHAEQMQILSTKGADYTGGRASEDGNFNFKEVAKRLEGAPMNAMTVWMVYLEKHIMALETFVKTQRVESEGMAGRFDDVANYACIGRTLFEETLFEESASSDHAKSPVGDVLAVCKQCDLLRGILSSKPEEKAAKNCTRCNALLKDPSQGGLCSPCHEIIERR